jgi:hypothetical protein
VNILLCVERHIYLKYSDSNGACSSIVVEAKCYKLEGKSENLTAICELIVRKCGSLNLQPYGPPWPVVRIALLFTVYTDSNGGRCAPTCRHASVIALPSINCKQ